jgi:hypothetical protein
VIPFTGDTHELQFRKSPAQQWFLGLYHRTSAPLLNAQKSFSNDSQGMYIVGADGTSYGYTNDHDPSNINEAMNRALARFRAHPPHPVVISDAEVHARFAVAPPPKGVVVRVFTRITPLPQGCIGLNKGIGRDYLWIYPEEIQAMLVRTGKPSQPFKLPGNLVLRIARFHLVDNVRGSPDMWGLKEIKALHFDAHVARRTPQETDVAFTGRFALNHGEGQRGYEGRIEGQFTLTAAGETITRFRALATGKAWGDGTYNPNAPKGRYPLAVALTDATDPASQTVPPEAVSTENTDRAYRDPTLPSNLR